MSRANLAWLIGVPLFVALGAMLLSAAPDPDKDYQLVRSVADVLTQIDKHYVRKLSDDEKRKLVEDMINGGLGQLDQHSIYLNEQQVQLFDAQAEGEFGGVGIQMVLDRKPKFVTVDSPMLNSPAYEAGIQPGDVVLAVNGTSTEGMENAAARKLITGRAGTTVSLRIRRGAGTLDPEDLTLRRAMIELRGVEGWKRTVADPAVWDFFPDPATKIGFVRLTNFHINTGKEVAGALAQLEKAGAQGIILDLRDNPGGLLAAAVEVSEMFLDKGKIVATRDQEMPERRSWTAHDDKNPWENAKARPMAVLVNPNSASASEIVAAALAENNRAMVVGERSYGKGSVQKMYTLSDNKTAIKLTFEEWLTPTGKNIHRGPKATEADEWGVKPSAGLEVKISEGEWKQYVAFRRAVDVVPGKPGVAPAPKAGSNVVLPTVPVYTDPMVERALAHLKKQLGGMTEHSPRRLARRIAGRV
ncbi:MAG: S41 family peptidase [Gemmataceae bacterium]